MAGGSSRGGSGSSGKKKKKAKPLSKDPVRLAAAVLTLSKWASPKMPCLNLSLPKMDLHTHSTCSKSCCFFLGLRNNVTIPPRADSLAACTVLNASLLGS